MNNNTSAVIETITPDFAELMLEGNKNNRNVTRRRVDDYAGSMRRGQWKFNGETIKFAADGTLIDGQHRLLAVVESGVTIKAMVVYNLDKDSFKTIDKGKARLPGDALFICGEKNARNLGATLRLLYLHDNGLLSNRHNTFVSDDDLLETLAMHPMTREASSLRTGGEKSFTASSYSFVITKALETDKEKAILFRKKIKDGHQMDGISDPVLRLRQLFIGQSNKKKYSSVDELALIIKAWNYFYIGKKVLQLKWSRTGESAESFPDFASSIA